MEMSEESVFPALTLKDVIDLFPIFQDNVLLDGNFRVKIADFGLARHNDATATQSWALSYNFAAPELFGDYDSDDISSGSDRDVQLMKRTLKTDVYAFACLYYEVAIDLAVTRVENTE